MYGMFTLLSIGAPGSDASGSGAPGSGAPGSGAPDQALVLSLCYAALTMLSPHLSLRLLWRLGHRCAYRWEISQSATIAQL